MIVPLSLPALVVKPLDQHSNGNEQRAKTEAKRGRIVFCRAK